MTRSSPIRPVGLAGLALLLALSVPAPSAAQGRLAVGMTAPTQVASKYRRPGPSLFLSTESNLSTRTSFRLSVEGTYFRVRPETRAYRDDLLVLGVGLTLVFHGTGDVAPYALAGLGYRWMKYLSADNLDHPVGTLAGKAGVGLELPVRTWRLFAELEWSLYLTDRGADDFQPFTTRGLRAGFRIPLPEEHR